MYNIVFKNKQYTDDYYADTIEAALSIFSKLDKCEIVSIGYAYKHLGMYWQIDQMIMSHGQYKTLKQLSSNWFKQIL